MSDIIKDLAEVQSTMLITDVSRPKIIRAMSEIKKLQAENAEFKKQSQWISVEDELPEIGRTVEVWLQYERCYERARLNQWSDGEVCWTFSNTVYDECSNEITHWKPLSTPPEGE